MSGRGRGRGRGTKGKKGDGKSKFGSLQATKKRKENPFFNARAANEVRLSLLSDDKDLNLEPSIFCLWMDDPRKCTELKIRVVPHEGRWKGVPYIFSIKLKKDYPISEPDVKLVDSFKIFHPNINWAGDVCLGYRKANKWQPSWGLKTVANSLLAIFIDPNGENAQAGCIEIAELKNKDIAKFDKAVQDSLNGRTVATLVSSVSFNFGPYSAAALKSQDSRCGCPAGGLLVAGEGIHLPLPSEEGYVPPKESEKKTAVANREKLREFYGSEERLQKIQFTAA